MDIDFLIVLLALGFAAFFAVQWYLSGRRSRSEEKVLRGYFLLGLSGLMSKVAMADGRVSGDEAELASRIFNRMKLADAERAMCIGNFVAARREGLEVRDYAKRFMAYGNSVACEFLYDVLWRISMIDGTLSPEEDKLLADIALYLDLGRGFYENCKAGKHPRFTRVALKASGVPASLAALAR